MDYILTNEGAALMTKAVYGKDLIFTKAETGDGYTASPAALKHVIGKQQELTMNVIHEGSDLKITCFLTNHQLEEGYMLKQLGIYAKLSEEEEDTLVIVGQQYSGEQVHPFIDGEAEYEFTILMKASGTSSITVESGAGSLALKKDLNAHTNRQDNPHNVTAKQLGLDKVPNVRTSEQIPEFEEAEVRENIESGETLAILFGKIKRWLSSLKSGAFSRSVNNCTTTEEGTVLDGRQGKALQDEIEGLKEADSEINSKITTINSKLTAVSTFSYGAVTNVNGDNWLTLVKYGRLCILTGHVKGNMSNTHKATLQYRPLYHIEAPGASDGGLEGLFTLDTSGYLYAKKTGGGDAGGGALRVCISYITQ